MEENIRGNILEILEKYDGTGQVDECTKEIEEYLQPLNDTGKILGFLVYQDDDVFDSCGLDLYYIAASWVDRKHNINICGSRITSC